MAPELRRAARAASRATRAARERDDAIRAAVAAGYPLRAVAEACGLSFQRVHQLARAEPEPEAVQ